MFVNYDLTNPYLLTSATPIPCYREDKLAVFLAILKCSESEKRARKKNMKITSHQNSEWKDWILLQK